MKGTIQRLLGRHPRAVAAAGTLFRRLGRHGLAARLIRAARTQADPVPVWVPGRRRGAPDFYMDNRDHADQSACGVWAEGVEGFERPMPALFFQLALRLPGAVLDIGANSGLYSLLAAAAGRPCRAFEPFPPARAVLERNVALNRLESAVAVDARAVGDRCGQATLFVPLQDHGLLETSASLLPGFKERHSSTVPVDVITVDSYCNGNCPPDLMKVDVEGAEAGVLAGARETLATARPFVFLEVLPQADAAGIDRIRRELGYRSFRMYAAALSEEQCLEYDSGSWNHLLVPAEKSELLGAAARAAAVGIGAAG